MIVLLDIYTYSTGKNLSIILNLESIVPAAGIVRTLIEDLRRIENDKRFRVDEELYCKFEEHFSAAKLNFPCYINKKVRLEVF